jgi:hypothetical protein
MTSLASDAAKLNDVRHLHIKHCGSGISCFQDVFHSVTGSSDQVPSYYNSIVPPAMIDFGNTRSDIR